MSAERLSHLYADAFLNVFFDSLPEDILERLYVLQERMKTDEQFQIVSSLPGFKAAKKEFFLKLFNSASLDLEPFNKLIDLLLSQRRSFLLQEIIAAIVQEFKKRARLLDCTIRSAQPLDSEEQKRILEHASHILGYTILPTWIIDPSLIAGIRFETAEYMYDHSIRHKLNVLAVR
jgi:F-type H+-transporting ATPase subunit delta